ncbi:MAG: hypothetical protein M3Q03_06230 [Chloroflexota bacterium]|nr:hypothetical protein [Chloroflexota bacterium]
MAYSYRIVRNDEQRVQVLLKADHGGWSDAWQFTTVDARTKLKRLYPVIGG